MKRRKLNKLVGKWRPYDFCYNLMVEREMFRKQAEYFAKADIADDSKDMAKKCELLVRLLDIVIDETKDLEIIQNTEIYKSDGFETMQIKDHTWKLHKYVNTKNCERFAKWIPIDRDGYISDFYKNELRLEKAWHLYNNLRTHFMQTLWD